MPGNNHNLVERVFREGCPNRAEKWYECSNKNASHYHFRWSPLSNKINFDRLSYNFTQIANKFEGHPEISRKHDLFKNLKSHLDFQFIKQRRQDQLLFSIVPLQFHVKITMAPPQVNPVTFNYQATANIAWDSRAERSLR